MSAQLWVVSDTHFSHANIIRFCGRPFSCAEEMDEILIQRWNAVVRPEDHVWHLGDVALSAEGVRVARRLTGHKRLILGNHDDRVSMSIYASIFEKIRLWRRWENLVLSHVPLHRGSFGSKIDLNVHGHIHQNPSPPGPYLNVCVEVQGYQPIPIEEVRKQAAERLALCRDLTFADALEGVPI